MKAPSTEQLLEQNGKSNTYDCVIQCDCLLFVDKRLPTGKTLDYGQQINSTVQCFVMLLVVNRCLSLQ